MPASPATRDSWQNKPMPEARARLAYERRFTAQEHRRVALGIVPRNTDDKWLIFLDGDWLTLHRSWTGVCIYAVRLARVEEGSEVVEAWANRAPEEYTRTDE